MNDNVNHPAHYTSGKFETIEIIQDKLTPEMFEGFCVGNVLKYITRYKLKNGIEDLKKARWYLDKVISVMQAKDNIETISIALAPAGKAAKKGARALKKLAKSLRENKGGGNEIQN